MGFGSMPTAIVIDDDIVATQLFADLLRMFGVKVLACGYDGKDAVRLYKKYTPDIVFTDIMMPENDGFNAKVVAVTADFTEESATRLEELKISAVVYKPFDIQDIKRVLLEKYQMKIKKKQLANLLKEEKLVVDLELAVEKEKFKNKKIIHTKLEF
jgi:CheY-like chemotaxis protein